MYFLKLNINNNIRVNDNINNNNIEVIPIANKKMKIILT